MNYDDAIAQLENSLHSHLLPYIGEPLEEETEEKLKESIRRWMVGVVTRNLTVELNEQGGSATISLPAWLLHLFSSPSTPSSDESKSSE